MEDLPETPPLDPTLFPRVIEFAQATTRWRKGTFHQSYRMAKTQLQDWLTRP